MKIRTRALEVARRAATLKGDGKRSHGSRPKAQKLVNRLIQIAQILVPIDFTRESVKPLLYASSLAEVHGGQVLLLHVTPPIKYCVDCGYGPVDHEIPDEVETHRDRSRLRRFAVKHLRADLLGGILIRSGVRADEMIRTAPEQ